MTPSFETGIDFDEWTLEKASCPPEEKRPLLALAEYIARLSAMTHDRGVIVLEPLLAGMNPPLLRHGLTLVADGNDPRLIGKELYIRTLADGKKGAELLERILVCGGVFAIQQGLHPLETATLLAACFGDDMIEETEQSLRIGHKELRQRLEEGLAKLPDGPAREPGTLLEERVSLLFSKLPENRWTALEYIMGFANCKIDRDQAAAALGYASSGIRNKILRHIRTRQALIIVESPVFTWALGPAPTDAQEAARRNAFVIDSQKQILKLFEGVQL